MVEPNKKLVAFAGYHVLAGYKTCFVHCLRLGYSQGGALWPLIANTEMEKRKIESIKKYGFEFLTIFVGVVAAFALDNWNENRKDNITEVNILTEINNGLSQDLKDISVNIEGHKYGLQAANYYRSVLLNKPRESDSLVFHYFNLLRDFISVQNISGYETLKSKGLDIVTNDSLRTEILALYENDYNTLRKLEEEYDELQFFETFHKDFNNSFAGNFVLDQNGKIMDLKFPLKLTGTEKKILFIDLWRISTNRIFILDVYVEVKSKITRLQRRIKNELKR